MHLMYYLSETGQRMYTLKVRACVPSRDAARRAPGGTTPCDRTRSLPLLSSQKETPDGKPTESAHPARFSPDDKFSKHRLICKKRFGLLPMQNAAIPL